MEPEEVPGLPGGVAERLRAEGVAELYPPQAAAVEAGVTDGESLVASVPTASGKTLIATMAMLSAVERGGIALYIVPLRALASEKYEEFSAYEELGYDVAVTTGNYESDEEWLESQDVVVATAEKVDSLLRNDARWLEDLSCVVADEVHLVDDPDRGPTLEVTLAKLRFVNSGVQTVALSATVDNADAVADWLDASLVDSSWRPIELRRGVHYGSALHFEDGTVEELPVDPGEEQTEAIVADTLGEGGSTLVFVNSRRNAEAAARRLAGVVDPELDDDERRRLADLAADIAEEDTETARDLAATVERGAAFHHAGLSRASRSAVEDAFRDRLLKVVAATPTLAAGVNTPSRRVVVRDWRRYDGTGMSPLDTLEVHQMMGRAGRPGYDDVGEALLLAGGHDELDELFERYVGADPEPVRSKLAAEPALRTHVLATVATGVAGSQSALLDFFEDTLYAVQSADADDGRLAAAVEGAVDYLERNDFLERSGPDRDRLRATEIGHTVSQLYLDPMSAATIIDGLTAAAEAGREPSALGYYHLVSRTPDMYELYLRSGDRETYTEVAYEREPELPGDPPSEFEEARFEDWLAALKTARLLEDWAEELDRDRITDRYGVGPGDVRGKVDTAEWLLGAAERLAGEVGTGHAPAIREAKKRVADGVGAELLDLVGVREVGRVRARKLYDAGIESPADLREAPKPVVLHALDGRRKTAETILDNAGRRDPAIPETLDPRPPDAAGSGGDHARGTGAADPGGGDGDPDEGDEDDGTDRTAGQSSLADF